VITDPEQNKYYGFNMHLVFLVIVSLSKKCSSHKKKIKNSNKIALISQLTMAINGPNEVPNTNTTIKPSLTKFMGEKSQMFTPKSLSCFSARWQGKKVFLIQFVLYYMFID